jgi:hypothetical protein
MFTAHNGNIPLASVYSHIKCLLKIFALCDLRLNLLEYINVCVT